MAGERIATAETLPPAELGKRTHDQILEIRNLLLSDSGFKSAVTLQFFSKPHERPDPIAIIDNTVQFHKLEGHDYVVHFEQKKYIRDTGVVIDARGSTRAEEYIHIALDIEKISRDATSKGVARLATDLQKPPEEETRFIGGRIDVPNSEPDRDETFSELRKFMDELYPHW